jgi:transposase
LGLRPDGGRLHEPLQAAKLALRSLARRVDRLDDEILELDRQLERLVATAAPRTVELFGVGTQAAGQLLVTAGQNIGRLRSEAAFAKLCGVAPIQASSGRSTRHRLDFGGDRQANRALHMIAVCRLRHCERTRAYADKRSADGLNRREILRASSATSPARATTPFGQTWRRSTALDIYRNVPPEPLVRLLSIVSCAEPRSKACVELADER